MENHAKALAVTKHLALIGLVMVQPAITEASEQHGNHCEAVKASVEQAGFANDVLVTCNDGHAYLHSDTYPDHELMTGIVGTNEQVPVPAKDHIAPIPLKAALTENPKTRDSSLGIAVNGVPIFDYTGGGEMSHQDLFSHQREHDTILTHQLDVCGGHAGRGDDYHYHARPTCMIEQMENADDNPIIGWAFDGYPIYGHDNPDGTPIEAGTLDVCNGQADEIFGYRYHTSEGAPYIIQCLMGEVADVRQLPKVAPLQAALGSRMMDPGRPPRGGVENLMFSKDSTGQRSMDYSYEGEAYYMRYAPSGTPNCYNFETRTVTNGGEVRSGEYCR